MYKFKFSHCLGVLFFAVCVMFEFGNSYQAAGVYFNVGDTQLNIVGVPAAIWLFAAGLRLMGRKTARRQHTETRLSTPQLLTTVTG